jgi:hypothetical protein
MYLQMCFYNQTKEDKKITISKLIKNKDGKCKYYLMDVNNNLHSVCSKFFIKLYKISKTTILKYFHEVQQQPIKTSSEKKQGKWKRTDFKNKINVKNLKSWILKQKIQLSHYTRRFDKQNKYYFTDFTCLENLYQEYKKEMGNKNETIIKKTSFKKYFKLIFGKKIKFQKNHLDVCSVCSRMEVLWKKISKKPENIKNQLRYFKLKHLKEVDLRYKLWKKDKILVQSNLTEIEEKVIEESKIFILIKFFNF